jgi:hypothetical protein
MFCVLIEFHPMVGVDLHKDQPPPPAPPVPFAPHATAALLNWVVPASTADTVKALYGRVMQRGTDIQNLIPHIPLTPAALLAGVLTGLSGSKSDFGPASVKAGGKPIAAAVAVVVNFNLNCGDIPTPTGIVIAPNTVVTGMTLGDILGGVFAMVTEAAIQTAMNLLLGDLGPWEAGIVGMFLGSPLGFSFNANGTGSVGLVGRLASDVSDFARSEGERMGGDYDQADADRDAVGQNLVKELKGNPLSPAGWDLAGDGKTAAKAVENAITPLPARLFSGAIDNPAVESF